MKKLIAATMAIIFWANCSIAQNSVTLDERFTNAMETNLNILDTATAPATYMMLVNNFDRIGTAAKVYWQPYYYASLCYTLLAMSNTHDVAQIDPLTAKAEEYIAKAEELSKANSEITALQAMIINVQIITDPMNRFQEYSKRAGALLEKAKQQNPMNPRPFLIEARTLLRVPEAFGGGPAAAKPVVEKAIAMFKQFIPENTMSPKWGFGDAQRIVDKIGK